MGEKFDNFFGSMLINLFIFLLPFIISFFYSEPISERGLTMTVAMFLAGVTISLNFKNKTILISLIIIEVSLVAAYGSIPAKSTITNLLSYQTALILVGIIVLGFDKYNLHVRKGEPLNFLGHERNVE